MLRQTPKPTEYYALISSTRHATPPASSRSLVQSSRRGVSGAGICESHRRQIWRRWTAAEPATTST